MAEIIAAGIASVVGALCALWARHAERRPPLWAVGLAAAAPAFVVAMIAVASSVGPTVIGASPSSADRVFAVDADTGEHRTLIEAAGSYGACAWSPDGSRVAVTGACGTDWAAKVLVVDPTTGDVDTFGNGSDSPQYPAWSPDGTTIAYWGTRTIYTEPPAPGSVIVLGPENRKLDLTLVEPATGASRVGATIEEWPHEAPRWSPDGSTVAVTVGGRNPWIELIDVATGTRERLETGLDWPSSLTWAPDGSALAFIDFGSGGPGVWITSPNASDIRQLATGFVQDVAWSPAGGAIAYVIDEPPQRAVWTVAPDGSQACRVVAFPQAKDVGGLVWSPDGTRLALWAYFGEWPEILVVDVQSGTSRSVATVYSDHPAVERPDAPSLRELAEEMWRILRGAPAAPTFRPGPSVFYLPPDALSWSPDGQWIAFSSAIPHLQTLQRAESAASTLLLILFALATPTALCAAIWAWFRHGRSRTTILCVVAAGLPTALEGLILFAILASVPGP